MAYVDVKLCNSYIGAALPVFTHSHDYEYCQSSLFSWHGAAICDFIFGVEMGFLGIRYSVCYDYLLRQTTVNQHKPPPKAASVHDLDR